MGTYSHFVGQYRHLLFFGFVLTFFSAFGQTFLLSLYIPWIGSEFLLSNTQISSLYAVATFGSALALPLAGRYFDIWPLQRYTTAVIGGLSLGLLILSFSVHPWMILLGLGCLRLTGQGLMSHTAVSTMARSFEAARGKAISLATLGHPAGEALMPALIAGLIAVAGWRIALQCSAGLLLLGILPLSLILIQNTRAFSSETAAPGSLSVASRPIKQLLAHRSFWIILPAIFLWGMINTAVFLFQLTLGEKKGWTVHWIAGSFAAFALANAFSMILSGHMVDRFTARRTYPYFLVPQVFGLNLLGFSQNPLVYPLALFLMGLSNGAGSTMLNTVLAEVYGTRDIGAVRSFFAMTLVISTAIGPVLMGALLDAGWPFELLLPAAAALVVMGIIWSLQILPAGPNR